MGICRSFVSLWVIAGLLLIAGCASTPKPVDAKLNMVSSINANPDARNRPSPVVVRVFELKSLAAFSSADFFSLWDRDKETLGSELVSREEYTLLPGDTRLQDCKLQVDAQYVGVIAAFRDLEHSQWRATLEIPRGKVKTITVQVTGKTLALEAK